MAKHVTILQRFTTYCRTIAVRWRRAFRWWHIPAVLGAAVICGLTVVFVASLIYNSRHKNPTEWGTSFSANQAQWLGLDWQKNYVAILDDLQIKHLRLMSYWNSGEPSPGQYNFADLDWQFAEAHKRGVTISLSVGLRQPRWPECRQPDWTFGLNKQQQQAALESYLAAVVKRYGDHPALESYQLENEALLNVFGKCPRRKRTDLDAELKLIHALDRNTPVYMSISDQYGLPVGKPRPDGFGFSLYRKNWAEFFYFTYPFLPSWYAGRAQIIQWYTGDKPVFIHELQLEPWGPRPIPDLSLEEQDRTMSREQVSRVLDYARQTHIPRVYTWGSEWWYWRKVVKNDPTIWETVRAEMKSGQ